MLPIVQSLSSSWSTIGGCPGFVVGSACSQGHADGSASIANFSQPWQVSLDVNGRVFVAEVNNDDIRLGTPDGSNSYTWSTIGGCVGGSPCASFGYVDGNASIAKFSGLRGISVDVNGRVFVADSYNKAIRLGTPDGNSSYTWSTIGGCPGFVIGSSCSQGYVDGNASIAKFSGPISVSVAVDGRVFVADSGNSAIRLGTPDGNNSYTWSTIGGCPGFVIGSSCSQGYVDGNASIAKFKFPHGVSVAVDGRVFVADSRNNAIRLGTPDSNNSYTWSTIGGCINGTSCLSGYVDGNASIAMFNDPHGISVDVNGLVVVSDTGNNAFRMVRTMATPTVLPATSINSALENTNDLIIGLCVGLGSACCIVLLIFVYPPRRYSDKGVSSPKV